MAKKKASSGTSAGGFLLMDSSLRPLWLNAEAAQILSYPAKPDRANALNHSLGEKIRTSLANQSSPQSRSVTEVQSGRRRYLCRAFLLESYGKQSNHQGVAVLLERSPLGLIALSRVSEQFKLTQQEGEVLEFLLLGLTSKEIANHMQISVNTVKVYLRLVMAKMGVSTRSGILGKIMTTTTPP
jgi:DNA-binding NarL/FixJ family response regulator